MNIFIKLFYWLINKHWIEQHLDGYFYVCKFDLFMGTHYLGLNSGHWWLTPNQYCRINTIEEARQRLTNSKVKVVK